MKHRIFGKKLGRNHNERQALFKSLTKSMFTHGAITTTEAKAKAVTRLVENLSSTIMTKSELTARRELFRILQDRNWVNVVVTTFKTTFAGQTSNFTKLTRIKFRQGDNAIVTSLSFVKPVEFKLEKEAEKKVEEKPKKVAAKKVAAKKTVKKPAKKVKVEANKE